MTPIATCTHRTPHRHGTVTGYTVCRCRCTDCLAATRNSTKTRQHKGVYNVPVDRALAHVDSLRAAGMSDLQISTAAKVAYNTIYWLGRGRKTVRPMIERRILAVRLSVTAVGVQRRLRALMAIGWSGRALAAELGVSPAAISESTANNRSHTTRARAETIAALYDRLWSNCPEPCRFTVEYAKARRWPSPLAWDDDTIDDLRAKPKGMDPKPMSVAEIVEDLLDMAAGFRSWTEACQRLGYSPPTLERRLFRAGRMGEVRAAFRREAVAA